MTLTLELPPETRASELASLLASWRAEAPDEQRETGQYLLRTLDEDRLSERKLFPPEGRGVTW